MSLHCADNARHPKRIATHMTITYGKLLPPLLPFILLELVVSLSFLASLAICLREDRLEVSNGLATQQLNIYKENKLIN